MMRAGRWSSTLALAVSCSAMPARSEHVCAISDTLTECYERFEPPSEEVKSGTKSEVAKDLAGKTTGADSFASQLASTIKDFNNIFRGLIQSSNESDDGTALTLDFNLKPFVKDRSAWQLQGVIREPEVYEPLELALPEATQETRASQLKDEMSDLDDVSIALSWSLQSRTLGRAFAGNSDLYSQMVLALVSQVKEKSATKRDPTTILHDVSRTLKEEQPDFDIGTAPFSEIVDTGLRDKVMSDVEQYSREQFGADAEFRALANEANLILLADLINNQPQVHASASYRWRDPLGGPDEISAKATYEYGFANLNSLRHSCESCDAAELLSKLKSYGEATSVRSALEHSDRLSVSVEYNRVGSYQFSLPADGVTLDLDASYTLAASLAYGRYVSFDAQGNERGRFDLKAEYQDFGDDPTRQRRAVASAVYTQKLTDDWSIPIGLTWANREEFVGDSQKKLAAHLGLTYKVPWKQ